LQQQGAKENKMKWDRIEGNWQQLKGNFKRRWRKLTNVDVIAGNREQLALNIGKRYGITTGEAKKQLADWQARQKEVDRSSVMP
jgi:uncharacterized protein YjbJ (UPF0337 family)